MKIRKFKTYKDDMGLPGLVVEEEHEYNGWLNTSRLTVNEIVRLMVETFKVNRNTEEYGYELCFDVKMRLIGVFEISHGDLIHAPMAPREIFQKALYINAAGIILMHNHPSGSCKPSKDDEQLYERVKQAGEILGVQVHDSIVIGDREAFTAAGKRAIIW